MTIFLWEYGHSAKGKPDRQAHQDALTTIRSTLQQDGKTREQFSTDTSKMLTDSLKAMEDMAQRLEQRIMKKVVRASILSAVLSVLACAMLLHLVS